MVEDKRCLYLNSECLNVVCSVSSAGKVGEVELDLVPAIVQPHRHGTNEGLHPRGGLVV